MKTEIKRYIIGCIYASVIAIGLIACKDNTVEDAKKIAEEHNEAKFDEDKEYDAKFLVQASAISREEIQLGQLAQSKALTPEVKRLARMMTEDHSVSLNEVESMASRKMITLPSALGNDQVKTYNKLVETLQNDFDEEYCELMVAGHKEAIQIFETAAEKSTDMEIREWSMKTLPTLRMHLDHSMNCAEKYKP